MLVSTSTPTPSLTISPEASAPSSLGGSPTLAPSPSATPIGERAAALGESDLGVSEEGAPVFRIDQAVITALAQNPAVLTAIQEIRRTKGVIISVRAQALPQIGPSFQWDWTDPNLRENTTFGATVTPPPGGTPFPGVGGVKNLRSDIAYHINFTGTQEIVNYSSWSAIRGTFFQRDSAYFSLRNIVDSTIALVKTEFYQVIVNRELIVVQEDSVNLLESQLKDQQNRFEAGTVPRFNVL